jgi:hypothetical protein
MMPWNDAMRRSDDDRHCLRQRIVDIGELRPVTRCSGKEHDANRQHYQSEDACDVGYGNRPFRVFSFFGSHSNTFNREEEPYRKRDGGEDSGDGMYAEMVLAGPSSVKKIGETEAGRDDGHED